MDRVFSRQDASFAQLVTDKSHRVFPDRYSRFFKVRFDKLQAGHVLQKRSFGGSGLSGIEQAAFRLHRHFGLPKSLAAVDPVAEVQSSRNAQGPYLALVYFGNAPDQIL